MFIKVQDVNLVFSAINTDHIVAVTLSDNGRTTFTPLVAILLADGTLIKNVVVPVPNRADLLTSVNAAWNHQQLTDAITAFYADLP